jgi:hypothetical protein
MKNWNLSRTEILNAPVPADTNSYTAIPHSVFLDELQNKLQEKQYDILEERYLCSKDAQIVTGSFTVKDTKSSGSELAPTLFFTNSYNKMKRASIRAGVTVLVCKNGMMAQVDKSSYSRRHSGDALEDIKYYIDSVVGTLEREFNRMSINMQEMRNIDLSKDMIAQLAGDMFLNEQLITATQLGILNKELKFSTNFKDTSLWSFYNNCTEAFKDSHPMFYDKQHVKFHTYISDKFKLTGFTGLYGEPVEVSEIGGVDMTQELEEAITQEDTPINLEETFVEELNEDTVA